GRVCPGLTPGSGVFVNFDNMVDSTRCLYYDSGNTAQTLDAAGTSGTEASDWLQDFVRAATGRGTSSSYYEGNIKTCADKGMRLPVMYETTMTYASWMYSYLPTADSITTPTWAGTTNGVPSHSSGWTWTASACPGNNKCYWVWSGSEGYGFEYGGSFSVRCVLPSGSSSYSDFLVRLRDGLTDESSPPAAISFMGNATRSSSKVKKHSFSYAFDGAGDYIAATASKSIGSNDFTVEFWLYMLDLPTTSSGSGVRGIFESSTNPTNGGGGGGEMLLRAEWTGSAYRYTFGQHYDPGNLMYLTPSEGIAYQKWQHIAVTRDGNGTRVYVNGVLQGTSQAFNSLNWTSAQFNFGVTDEHAISGTFLHGFIDDIKVTFGAALYNQDFTPP
ncbi:MAG: LamG domain-containing protein, partial [Proteobacteria bacterium]|nr:LamG domain-containing protein [Pseudomonadota bacterium]